MRTVAVAPTKPAPGSKTLRDPDLLYTVRYPPPYTVGRDDHSRRIFASLVIDRWNAIVFTRLGTFPMTTDDLERSLLARARKDRIAPLLIRERRGKMDVLTFTLPARTRIAGRPVGAKRIYFPAADEQWEISCQFTRATRARAIRACNQIASTLRI